MLCAERVHDVDVAGPGVDSRASGCGMRMVCSVCVRPVVTRGVRVNIVKSLLSEENVRFYLQSIAPGVPPG